MDDAHDMESIAAEARADAERGDAEAAWFLAVSLTYGDEGFRQDEREALKWLRRAAARGHPQALYHLGWRYESGEGVPHDPAEAERLYALAAAQDHPGALEALGLVCLDDRPPPECVAARRRKPSPERQCGRRPRWGCGMDRQGRRAEA